MTNDLNKRVDGVETAAAAEEFKLEQKKNDVSQV